MKITHANVADFAKARALEPIQIDGVPEGFSFKEPDLMIGDLLHEGDYVAFIPLREWEDEKSIVRTATLPALQTLFKKYNG